MGEAFEHARQEHDDTGTAGVSSRSQIGRSFQRYHRLLKLGARGAVALRKDIPVAEQAGEPERVALLLRGIQDRSRERVQDVAQRQKALRREALAHDWIASLLGIFE